MATAGLEANSPQHYWENDDSATYVADFLLNDGALRDLVFDRAEMAGKGIRLDSVLRVSEHLRAVVDQEEDFFERLTLLETCAEQYHDALDINPAKLNPGERSAQVTSSLFLSNIEALAALRYFVVDRYWSSVRRVANDDPAKMRYLEKRKVYQDDLDTFYNYFNGEVPLVAQDETLMEVANLSRLLVNRHEWVGAITNGHNHEFVGSVLSERVVKQSLRDHGFADTRYGTAEEDASPTKADVVVPLGDRALHLQVKMRWLEPTEFKTQPDRSPMGVVVPMHVIRGALTRPEHRELYRSVSRKADLLAA